MRSTVFYMKTWSCTAPYLYFNLTSNKCQDVCGSYYYEVTSTTNGNIEYECKTCHYTCESCTSDTMYDCSVCLASDNREKSGNSCVCKYGTMDDFENPKCIPCTEKLVNCLNCFKNETYDPADASAGSL